MAVVHHLNNHQQSVMIVETSQFGYVEAQKRHD